MQSLNNKLEFITFVRKIEMFRVEFFSIVILLFSRNCNAKHFVKNGHSFERVFQNDTVSSMDPLPKPIPDYISVTQTLLDMLRKDNSSVEAQHLNKFNLGLHQYYLSLAYEMHYRRSVPKDLKLDLKDPVRLTTDPGACSGEPRIQFHDVRAYGFPGFKKCSQKLESEQDDPYLQYYKIRRTFTSDAMILTGYFSIFKPTSNYFFVYYIRNNTLESIQTKLRSNEGKIYPKRTKDSLHFEREDLAHTFASHRNMFSIANATLYKNLMSLTEQKWLPELVSLMNEKLYPESVQANAAFVGIYRQKLAETLIESAKQYIKLINPSGTFEASPLNATSSSQTRTFLIKYVNLGVEGILNFDNFTIYETKFDDQANTSFVSETVNFQFSERSQAFVKFSIINNEGKFSERKYAIMAINLTCAYNLITDQMPFSVSRKRDAFSNGSGFLISFDMLNYDFFFDFIVSHIGNDMARSISNVLDSEKDVFNVDFENLPMEMQ